MEILEAAQQVNNGSMKQGSIIQWLIPLYRFSIVSEQRISEAMKQRLMSNLIVIVHLLFLCEESGQEKSSWGKSLTVIAE